MRRRIQKASLTFCTKSDTSYTRTRPRPVRWHKWALTSTTKNVQADYILTFSCVQPYSRTSCSDLVRRRYFRIWVKVRGRPGTISVQPRQKKPTFESRHLQILFFHIGGRVSVQFLGETDLIRTHRFVGVPQLMKLLSSFPWT